MKNNEFRLTLDRIQIVVALESKPPFSVDAMVIEQDTYLVLSPPVSRLKKPSIAIHDLINQAMEVSPVKPGQVVINHTVPMQISAVIHDLSKDPSWRKDWIQDAIDNLVKTVLQYSISALALPCLGSVHGMFEIREFMDMFRSTLIKFSPQCLKKIWLYTPEKIDDFFFELID